MSTEPEVPTTDLADHDLFECSRCGEEWDIEDSFKRSDEYLCPECVEGNVA